jgi:endonuclease/exonuclease/phosphatase family metal-dependent hydrolase
MRPQGRPVRATRWLRAALVWSLVFATACGAHYGYNFPDAAEPRFANPQARTTDRRFDGKIKIVTFNIKFGQRDRVAKAIDYLRTDPVFRDPDILFLQEMSCDAVEALATKLGGNWVYYPAAWHPQGTQWEERASSDSPCPAFRPGVPGGYFGVGIVTPWTIRDDQKILLPQLSPSDDAQKVALAATIDFGAAYHLRAVNVHLQSGLSPVHVADQVQVITRCVFGAQCPAGTRPVPVDYWAIPGPHGAPGNVVLAGDFNTASDAHIQVMTTVLAPQAAKVPLSVSTFWLLGAVAPGSGRLDHVFHGEGLEVRDVQVGTKKVSDHRPVMVSLAVAGKYP